MAAGAGPAMVQLDFRRRSSEIMPTQAALSELLQATYFSVHSKALLDSPPIQPPQQSQIVRFGWRRRLRTCLQALKGLPTVAPTHAPAPMLGPVTRTFVACTPFAGTNEIHSYPPPFGLEAYDDRFRAKAAA